jgi:hypothetical protein
MSADTKRLAALSRGRQLEYLTVGWNTIEGVMLQIVQGPGYVALLHEQNHSTRIIPTDGRPHVPQDMRLWQGDSVGHWEGTRW